MNNRRSITLKTKLTEQGYSEFQDNVLIYFINTREKKTRLWEKMANCKTSI